MRGRPWAAVDPLSGCRRLDQICPSPFSLAPLQKKSTISAIKDTQKSPTVHVARAETTPFGASPLLGELNKVTLFGAQAGSETLFHKTNYDSSGERIGRAVPGGKAGGGVLFPNSLGVAEGSSFPPISRNTCGPFSMPFAPPSASQQLRFPLPDDGVPFDPFSTMPPEHFFTWGGGNITQAFDNFGGKGVWPFSPVFPLPSPIDLQRPKRDAFTQTHPKKISLRVASHLIQT